jgi:hypothetical protein
LIPDHILSSTAIPAPFLHPDELPWLPLVDREFGGIALRDPSQGSQVQVWTLTVDGDDVKVATETVESTTLFSRSGITEAALAFDQNMNPAVAFMQDGVMFLWWFDTLAVAQVFTEFDDGSHSPRVCLDDKRRLENGTSDIILSYVRDNTLYFRAQRDRFQVETALANVSGFLLRQVGMNSVNRLQWAFIPDPGSAGA